MLLGHLYKHIVDQYVTSTCVLLRVTQVADHQLANTTIMIRLRYYCSYNNQEVHAWVSCGKEWTFDTHSAKNGDHRGINGIHGANIS